MLARDQTGTCALLTADRTCGAFPSWPLSCARYPYALDLQRRVVFWAKGCGSSTVLPSGEAPENIKRLYNELCLILKADMAGVKTALKHTKKNRLAAKTYSNNI